MSKSVILSLLAQGNTGTEILTILDSIVESIVQENIDSCAEVFAVITTNNGSKWYGALSN